MNGILLNSEEDVVSEIKDMLEDIENVKAKIDIYSEFIKKQISFDVN